MARTTIPIQPLSAFGSGIPTLVWTAWDGTNTMEMDNDGKTLLLFMNRNNAGTRAATIKAVNDPYGRSVDIGVVCPIAAGAPLQDGVSVHGPFKPEAFNQPGGSKLNVDGAVLTDFYVAALRFP
jgi:hypothetical protein